MEMNSMWKALLVSLALAAVAVPAVTRAQELAAFKKEELEQLVAPIALYPDSLVAQILMASTYPLEVVEAARWVKSNPNVKDKALEDAMAQQKWDPSVKSLAAFPQVLNMMSEKIDMTQKMGDAFLGQQKEVLAAVQRLRSKAQAAGNLKSGQEQTVSTAQEGGTTVIKIEPTQPETVYVPTYNPATVYGAWPYPAYPPYYYYPPGYAAGAALFTFTAGVIVGNALWGNCNWGGGNVNVNVNKYNNFNRSNIQNSNWSHNAEHRKGVQYRDTASQQRYGKGQREGVENREQFRGRAEQGRQDIARGGADQFKGAAPASRGERPAGAGGAGERQGSGAAGDRGAAAGSGGAGDRGAAAGSGGAGDRGAAAGSGGAGDRGGGGGVQRTSSGAAAYQGAGSGAQTRDYSSRGAASQASSVGRTGGSAGGGARAGGGGGGGGRGGGGGGRR
jgi:hypothetical protein